MTKLTFPAILCSVHSTGGTTPMQTPHQRLHPTVHPELWKLPDFNALYHTPPMSTCHRVVFHHGGAHVDEVGALWLAIDYGSEYFPGISQTQWVYREDADERFEGKTGMQLYREGTLPIGTAGGPWDEHPIHGQQRVKGECSMSLMAKYLRVDTDPAIKYLLDSVIMNDTQGRKMKGGPEISQNLGLHYRYSRQGHRRVMENAIEDFRVNYRSQVDFLEVPRQIRTWSDEIIRTRSGDVRLVIAESDNPRVKSWIKKNGQSMPTIVILKRIGMDDVRKAGTVQIFGVSAAMRDVRHQGQMTKVYDENHPFNLATKRMAAFIRAREMGVAPSASLEADGTVGTRIWFFQKNANNLFNGSEHALPPAATSIPLSELRDIIVSAYSM